MKTSFRFIFRFFIGFSLFFHAQTLYAQCDFTPGDDATLSLLTLYHDGCLGGQDDPSSIAVAIHKQLSSANKKERTEQVALGIDALQKTAEHFNYQASTSRTSIETDLINLNKRLLEQLRVYQGLNSSSSTAPAKLENLQLIASRPELQSGSWNIGQDDLRSEIIDSSSVISQLIVLDPLKIYISPNCAETKTEQCNSAFKRASETIRHTELIRVSLDYIYRNHNLREIIELAKLRVSQWDQYLTDGYPQWPYELWINGQIFKNSHDSLSGLVEPPSWQLVVLHPDVIFEYVDDAGDGDQFKPALMVEVLGVDVWQWDKTGSQNGPWGLPFTLGAGIVATWADRAETDDTAIGAILRINHSYNIGVTARDDGDVGFFVSLNLSSLITKGLGSAEKYFGL